MKRLILRWIPVLLGVTAAVCSAVAAEKSPALRPNVVVILADDLGFGSLGCYGGKGLHTPACDRLAREGRRFTNAYAPSSVCSPSRYALMTGRYYWRTAVKDGNALAHDAPLHIEPRRFTLGSLAKAQGYATAAIGKWHLGLQSGVQHNDWNAPLTPGPLTVGFDYFFGLVANVNNRPDAYVENDRFLDRVPGRLVAIEGRGKEQKTIGINLRRADDQVMGQLTAKVVAWLEANRDKPFFLYYAPNAVHEPVTPAARFRGSPLGKYGDFVEELDWSVGQVLDTLDRLKMADNTIVILTSDNGGALDPHQENSMIAVKAGLAVNGPLRGGKCEIWDGGFREPFIVRWPGRVPAGTVSEDILSLCDLPATLASLLNVPVPQGQAEDSRDVSTSWFGTTAGKPARDSVVMQAPWAAEYAIRQGPWKMIERENTPPLITSSKVNYDRCVQRRKHASPHDELYNLVDDPAETNDVSAEHPEVVARLRKLLNETRAEPAGRR